MGFKRSVVIVLLLGSCAFALPVPAEEKHANSTEAPVTVSDPSGAPSEHQSHHVEHESALVKVPVPSYRRSVPTYTPKHDAPTYDSPYPASACHGRAPGYYGNPEHGCRIFHVCQEDGRLETFDCPPYTKFNNYLLVCDWPFKVDYNCDPVYKEEHYPAKSHNPAYPVDKSYAPSLVNLYPAPKPTYESAHYEHEQQPQYPVVPIYNAHAKTYKSVAKSYVPAVYDKYEYNEAPYRPALLPYNVKPKYVKEPAQDEYEKTVYPVPYEKPIYHGSYEKVPAYPEEKSPVHVILPVRKPDYPLEYKPEYKHEYVAPKSVYRKSSYAAVPKVYRERNEEYASYEPIKRVVVPVYSKDAYEPNYAPDYKQSAPYAPEYKPSSPYMPEHKLVAPYAPEHKPSSPYMPEYKHVVPYAPEYKPSSLYAPEYKHVAPYAPEYRPSKVAYPESAYPAPLHEKAAPAYGEDKAYDKTYAAPGQYPVPVAAPEYIATESLRPYPVPEPQYAPIQYTEKHVAYNAPVYHEEKVYAPEVKPYLAPAYPIKNYEAEKYAKVAPVAKYPAEQYDPKYVPEYEKQAVAGKTYEQKYVTEKPYGHYEAVEKVYDAPYVPEKHYAPRPYDAKSYEQRAEYPMTVATHAEAVKDLKNREYVKEYVPSPQYGARLADRY